MDIGRELAQLRKQLERLERASRLTHASIENTALQVYDGAGSLRGILGQQADGTTAVNIVNGTPPPQPSNPIVASVLGGVTVSWDGQFAGGAVLPLDWQRVEVHAAITPVYEPIPATLQGTIETAQGSTVVVPCDAPVYVRLVARNTSGTASVASGTVGPFGPTAVVADDILDGIVTTVKLAAGAVTAAKVAVGAIDSTALADAAVTAQKIGTAAVTTGKLAAGAVNMNALTAALADTTSQRYVDAMGDPAAWTTNGTGTGATWTHLTGVTDAPTGQSVGQAYGYIRLRGTTLIPYDPDVLYRVSIRIRATVQPVTPDLFYAGVLGIGADGVTLVNRDGTNSANSHYYVAASGRSLPTSDGWVVVTGYLKGRAAAGSAGPNNDPRTPGVVHTNCRYITPYLWMNYNNQGVPAGTMQVDAVTIEALKTGVVDSTNLIAGSVTTAALAADSVTATQIAAGSVATSELAANAVTTGKLAAGAVTATEIAANTITAGNLAANSVTATAIAANSVQTAALAADSVAAGKIASDVVTAREIAGLTITAAEMAANSITVGKLAAGAVDATALAADAITGKTITGGTITGALIQTAASGQRITLNEAGANKVLVYNSGGTAIGELSSTGLLVKGTNGAILWLDPNNAYPNLRLTNLAGTNSAVINVSEPVSGNANLGMNSGTFSGSSWTDVKWRTYMGADFWVAERIRDSDAATNVGGRVFLDSTHASVGYQSTVDSTQNATLSVQQGLATLSGARMVITPPASANSGLLVSPASGHTGYLTRIQLDGADRFLVDKDGNATVAGNLTVNGIGGFQFKNRTTDATPRTNTTMANDSVLTFAVAANSTYFLDGFLKYSGPGDFQMGWSFPSGTLGEWEGIGNGTTVISSNTSNALQQDAVTSWGYTVRTETTDISATRSYGGITTNTFGVMVRGTIRVGATAGTLTLQWAEGASNATGTVLYTDSHLRLQRVA